MGCASVLFIVVFVVMSLNELGGAATGWMFLIGAIIIIWAVSSYLKKN